MYTGRKITADSIITSLTEDVGNLRKNLQEKEAYLRNNYCDKQTKTCDIMPYPNTSKEIYENKHKKVNYDLINSYKSKIQLQRKVAKLRVLGYTKCDKENMISDQIIINGNKITSRNIKESRGVDYENNDIEGIISNRYKLNELNKRTLFDTSIHNTAINSNINNNNHFETTLVENKSNNRLITNTNTISSISSSVVLQENRSIDGKFAESINKDLDFKNSTHETLSESGRHSTDDMFADIDSDENRTDTPISMQHFIHPRVCIRLKMFKSIS